MRRFWLPWWAEPFFQKGYYRRTVGRLSQEEAATMNAITRLFILLLLGWFVLEIAAVSAMRLTGSTVPPWVRLAAIFATPVVVVCAAALARRVIAARHPQRTAIADAKAATRRAFGPRA